MEKKLADLVAIEAAAEQVRTARESMIKALVEVGNNQKVLEHMSTDDLFDLCQSYL